LTVSPSLHAQVYGAQSAWLAHAWPVGWFVPLLPLLLLLVLVLVRGFSRSAVPDHAVPKPEQAPGHADCGVWQTLFTQRCALTTEWLVQSQ
jgi:hypothetical protein